MDALKILRHEADLPVSQAPGCKSIGTTIAAGLNEAAARVAGDVDCDGDVDLTDATEVLRHVAVLAVNLPPGCPAIGETVGG